MVPFVHIDATSCYWAGWLASDGNVYRNQISLKLCAKDAEQVEKFAAYVGLDHTLKGKGWRKASFSSATTAMFLAIHFNIVPKKTFTLKPPERLSSELCRHFIRGFFEGDGCLTYSGKYDTPAVYIASASPAMLAWLSETMRKEIGTVSSIGAYKHSRASVLRCYGSDAIAFLEWLYRDVPEDIAMNRKRQLFEVRKVAYEQAVLRRENKRNIQRQRNYEIVKAHAAGVSYDQLAQRFDLSRRTCRKIVCQSREVTHDR